MLRELQDKMKLNNIYIIGIPEGEEEEQGIKNLFEKVMMDVLAAVAQWSARQPANQRVIS